MISYFKNNLPQCERDNTPFPIPFEAFITSIFLILAAFCEIILYYRTFYISIIYKQNKITK